MYPEWMDESEEEIRQRMLSSIPPHRDKREGGFIYDVLAAMAKERFEGRKESKDLIDLNFADTATGTALDRVIETRSPLVRGEAKFSTGFIQVIGVPGTRIPSGTIYTSIVSDEQAGLLEFEQLEDAVIGDDGVVLVKAEAMIGGEIGNVPPGTITLAEPIPGIADVDNPDWFSGGEDEEDDDSFRNRYYLWRQSDVNGGNIDSYIKWAIEVPGGGVGGVQVVPLWNGRGTVKVILIGIDGKPASADVVQRVQEYIASIAEEGDDQAPIGATVTVVAGESDPLAVSATLVLTGTRSLADITMEFNQKLADFLAKVAKENWQRRAQPYYVSAARIGALILEIDGVKDYLSFTINGNTSSVEIASGRVAVVGTVTFSE
jgi:uncharacterized phage protein gp47/JayE